MSYCGPKGLAHSKFLSWDPDDQDKALAWMIAQNEVCPRCGTRNEDWVDERGHYRMPPVMEAIPIRCYGCAETDRVEESIPKEQRGIYVVARPYQEVPEKSREAR